MQTIEIKKSVNIEVICPSCKGVVDFEVTYSDSDDVEIQPETCECQKHK